MDTKSLGKLGERLTCEYLVSKGYNILGKNWRVGLGEIDIIAQKKSPFFEWLFLRNRYPIHFVEVKTIISNKDFFPEDRVNWHKQRKLKQLAQIWLTKNHYLENHSYQIDIAGVVINEVSRMAKLHYFFNAVRE